MYRRKSLSYIAGLIAFLVFNTAAFAQHLPEIQAAIKAKGLRWIAGETSVSILPDHEKRMRLGLIDHEPTGREEVLILGSNPPPAGDIDWRTYVTPVRDQGNCGSCWAFATTAALESYILMRDGLVDNYDRAEQILLSCGSAGSCNGGYIDRASNFIRDTGLPDESYFSYSATDKLCSDAGTEWPGFTDSIASWSYVTTGSPSLTAIKNALYSYGPLVTTMQVYDDFFSYSGGVYEYAYGSLAGGHAILIVGYKDDTNYGGGGYFIVKNSWGDWAEAGYFRIAYSQLGSPVYFGRYTIVYPQPVAVPATPSGLTASAVSSSQINLAWIDNSNNEDGFKIERCTGSMAGCSSFSQIATVGAGVWTYSDIGLAGSTTYTYRVRAYNTGGNSVYSNTAEATTFTPIPPGNPSGLSATAVSNSQINLNWTDGSNNETGFRIERCTGISCSSFLQIATVGANVTSYSNTGLTANTGYTYRVRAYVSGANSAYTNSASAATFCSCTISPVSKNFSSSGGSATVKVTAGCSWAATSNAPSFITITSQGSRSFSYSVAPNTGAIRTGSITVGGTNTKTLTHNVTQSAKGKR